MMHLLVLAAALPVAAEPVMTTDAAFAHSLNAGRALIRVSAGNEEQALLEALGDRNPEVRVQALKGLKNYVAYNSRTRDRVMDVLGSGSELDSVRREAARALSAAVGDYRVREFLLKHAQSRNNASAVRAMSYKALYWQTQFDESLRDDVLEAAERESDLEVRLAAIWALMYAGGDSDVRRSLLDLAQRAGGAVSREAAKSLYDQMRDSDVRRFARDAAERGSGQTRHVAIMMLATRIFEEDTRLLEDIAKRDSDPEARRLAVTALAGHSVEVVYFFHQNHYQWMGGRSRLISEAIDRE